MIAAVVNAAAIVLGTLLGVFFRKGLPEHVKKVLTQGMGLSTVLIGLLSAIKTQNQMVVLLSVIVGGLIGSLIGIEKWLDRFGARVQRHFSTGAGDVGRAFVSATLIFCVGSMAIVGSIDAGLRGEYGTIFAKSVLDGVFSLVLASTLGPVVALSGLAVLVYQGGLTLLAGAMAPLLTERTILEMGAVGGLLIVGIGLNMFRDQHLAVGDLLPAVFLPPLFLLFLS